MNDVFSQEGHEPSDDKCPKDHSRRVIRTIIFQMLYALESFDYSVTAQELAGRFNHGFDQSIPLNGEVVQVVTAIAEQREELDKILIPLFANWKAERVGCCTRLILRMGVWEMLTTNTPSTIIVNEAVELAKNFSEKDAYRFVNGVLDQVAKKIGRTF